MATCFTRVKFAAFALALAAAAAAPLLANARTGSAGSPTDFPGWPSHYEGRLLTELPLTEREVAFAEGFPGRIGRFSDGRREIILRWVRTATRRLHPASDCLNAVGYTLTPLPARRDEQGRTMNCTRAVRSDGALAVCERIDAGDGATWSDASSWYWHAISGQSSGPWWAVTIAEGMDDVGHGAVR